MTDFSFVAQAAPFPRWLGPFSPARGIRSGFRVSGGQLGTWVTIDDERQFWPVVDGAGVRALTRVVRDHWRGGRILLLPNGYVVKPLQNDSDVGRRALVGRFEGAVRLERPDGGVFDFDRPGRLSAGDLWPGPTTTGVECTILSDGSLDGRWYHPTSQGREEIRLPLSPPDRRMASGFARARPGEVSARVRVTANGHVITNRQAADGSWASIYVGRIDIAAWPHQANWIGRAHR